MSLGAASCIRAHSATTHARHAPVASAEGATGWRVSRQSSASDRRRLTSAPASWAALRSAIAARSSLDLTSGSTPHTGMGGSTRPLASIHSRSLGTVPDGGSASGASSSPV